MSIRRKTEIIILFFLVIICCVCSSVNATEIKREVQNKKLILIDPGHGGFDGGADGNGIKEKDMNLSISLQLKEALMRSGYDVLMTREKDEAVKLDKNKVITRKSEDMQARCKMKEESNCDMFISIHLNTYPESKYYGAQVWYSQCPESHRLGSLIQRGLRESIDPSNKRVEKPAKNSLKVLRCNDTIPGVIIECGFITNSKEAENLKSVDYQKKLADTITMSINEFYRS